MDYPNWKRLALALAAVAACSVWLAADMSVQKKPPSVGELPGRAMTVTSLADAKSLKPAHQSVAIESRNRAATVLGD